MKKIEATIGYRIVCDDGEIRYYSGWSGNGDCYKDDEAFAKSDGVCYIREATFESVYEDTGRDYVTNWDLDGEYADGNTRVQIFNDASDYFKDEIPEGYPYTEQFLGWVALVCYDLVDWQGVDIILDEMDWDFYEQEEGSLPLPWYWKKED